MFDGEDALGQVSTMSLDNQRNLKLAIHRDPRVHEGGRAGRRRDEQVGAGLLRPRRSSTTGSSSSTSRPRSSARAACTSTIATSGTPTAPASPRRSSTLRSTSSTTTRGCATTGASLVLYLPKIQTAEEAALWNDILAGARSSISACRDGTIKVYVLVEQIEACFQLMEIRAALGTHFVGFNTGRWDYINSVVRRDGLGSGVRQPEHRRHHDDLRLHARLRGPRAPRRATRPTSSGSSRSGRAAWSRTSRSAPTAGVASGMKRAVAGAEREQREGASGKWVAHWKMVHIVRPVWEKAGQDESARAAVPAARPTRRPTPTALSLLEPAPRTVRGARDLLSVALQYGNAFGQGLQAAALKPADFFGNDDVLYLMEDMATGEIRLSILWEWLHKSAPLTADDDATGVKAGDRFTRELFARLLAEEYEKLQQRRQPRRPRRLEDTRRCRSRARSSRPTSRDDVKLPWYVDLLNINLGDPRSGRGAAPDSACCATRSHQDGTRITENLDFESPT